MTPQEKAIIDKLTGGPIPVSLLLHLQESASSIEFGTIEVVLNGNGNGIDVITKERKRFDKAGA